MHRNARDLTGMVYGRLTVLRRAEPTKDGRSRWLCRCECGTEKAIRTTKLTSGSTVSCGCHRQENKIKHGQHGTRLYSIWSNMKQRCGNPNNTAFARYGGRGIKVCQEWASDFKNFYDWAIANGYQENLQIDRIDNDGDYTPENCRWTTAAVNLNHTSRSVEIELDGQIHTVSEWARITGIKERTIHNRMRAGKSPREILEANKKGGI